VAFSSPLMAELKGVPVHPVQLYALACELAVVAMFFAWPKAAPGVHFLRAVAWRLGAQERW